MFSKLLPSCVASVARETDDIFEHNKYDLFPEEMAVISRAVERRKRDFITARKCAHQALNQLGLPRSPILRGANGEPLWPGTVVGSITHCTGYCAAAVAMQRDALTIGIDVEVNERLPDGVVEQVLVPKERDWLLEAPEGPHWDKLFFSAKESVYKAWFPMTGRWLDFQEAVITFDPANQCFKANLVAKSNEAQPIKGFTGAYLAHGTFLFTSVVAMRRSP